jgi:hypothetical protein
MLIGEVDVANIAFNLRSRDDIPKKSGAVCSTPTPPRPCARTLITGRRVRRRIFS